jgi:hypothetical protein
LNESLSICSGFGGPSGVPLCVRYAKLTYSVPPKSLPAQLELRNWPVFWFRASESIVSAAHYCVPLQLSVTAFVHPGG